MDWKTMLSFRGREALLHRSGKMTLRLYGALNYSHGLSKGPSFGTGRDRGRGTEPMARQVLFVRLAWIPTEPFGPNIRVSAVA